jgi:2'-5' RNA ligase superfamily protein/aminoglycoside-2''-adenylyltransferase
MDRGTLPPDAFATGTIGGRAVGCLSPGLQVAFHRGYRRSRAVRRDVARLCTRFGLVAPPPPPGTLERIWRRALWRGRRLRRRVRREPHRGESSLVIPVPAADPVAPRWRDRSKAAGAGIPSHITVLYPFIPPDAIDDTAERAIASILAGFAPFRFRLDRVERFPGALYLAPEPVEPFVALTEALWAHWPEHPPYDGAYDTVIPHLTVFDGEEPPGVAEVIEGALPIEGEAREMWLMVEGADGRWTTRRRFPLTG